VIEFKVFLNSVTLLTVGGGVPEVHGADVVFVKLSGENGAEPYIPGSSVKGALRTSTTRIARHYGFTACGEIEPSRIKRAHSAKGICDVCRLFGYPDQRGGNSSPLFVSDFKLVVGSVKPELVTRVGLDRKRLIALEGALYTVEHLPPGTLFEGLIGLREEAVDLLPLLLLGMAELRMSAFGRRSLVDMKIEDAGLLNKYIQDKWRPLLQGLREWLWEGIV